MLRRMDGRCRLPVVASSSHRRCGARNAELDASAPSMLSSIVTSTAFGSAVLFGFRHGFDWDHLAALTDLTGSQRSSRRSMWVATLYAAGHATMVFALGAAAILFAARVPSSVDSIMERLVGVSLLGLGSWIAWTAMRTRGAPPLRSRWTIVIHGVRAMRARSSSNEKLIVIEHDHAHDHDGFGHRHEHLSADGPAAPMQGRSTGVAVGHRHLHRHVVRGVRDPFSPVRSSSAFGIGMLHGVGVETPTQILIFAAAANSSGRPTSIGLLACFVVGLVLANTLVAGASTLGFRRVLVHPSVAVPLAATTAFLSFGLGVVLLTGRGGSLPSIAGG